MHAARPQLLVHGHYHRRYTEQVGGTRIEGLDCDGKNGSAVVIDTEELRAEVAS